MKKTLIGEACIWLDKVDLRKRIVNWHKLLVSPTQTHWRNVSAQGIESALNNLNRDYSWILLVLSYVFRGNHEKRNKKQKHTQTFANVWLWNIEKTQKKSPYIEDKEKKKEFRNLGFLVAVMKNWEKFWLLNAKHFWVELSYS